jgi:Sel1 repeat
MHMRKSAGALILIIALIMAVPAIAEPLKDAKKAYDRRDYKTAVRLYKPLANKGDPEAQYALGYMYMTGKGVRKDHVEAYMWFNIAISQLSPLEDDRRKLVESSRNLVAVQMTLDQIAKAQRWAGEWKTMKEELKQIAEERRTAR